MSFYPFYVEIASLQCGSNRSRCYNFQGQSQILTCECNSGFIFDGRHCTNVTTCSSNGSCSQLQPCTAVFSGNYNCRCPDSTTPNQFYCGESNYACYLVHLP